MRREVNVLEEELCVRAECDRFRRPHLSSSHFSNFQ